MRKSLLITTICCIVSVNATYADEKVPCFIFSGPSGSENVFALDKYNRITFGNTSMFVSNPANPDDKIEMLYSAYNRFRVGDAVPSGIESVADDNSLLLTYDAATGSLRLYGDSGKNYAVGIFSISGVMVFQTHLHGDESVSLETLGNGVYIAIAIGENKTYKLKFVK